MTYHTWGDDWFNEHGNTLDKAMEHIRKTVKRYSGCHVSMKEKYGTIRYECLFVPGTAYYLTKYDRFLAKLFGEKKVIWIDEKGNDRSFTTPRVTWHDSWVCRQWNRLGRYVLHRAIQSACKKFPTVKDEILEDSHDL